MKYCTHSRICRILKNIFVSSRVGPSSGKRNCVSGPLSPARDASVRAPSDFDLRPCVFGSRAACDPSRPNNAKVIDPLLLKARDLRLRRFRFVLEVAMTMS